MYKIALLVGSVVGGLWGIESTALAQEKTRDYVIQEGDTCIRISRRELGQRKAYKEIHRLNPELGPSPHHLKVGSVLKLPGAASPDAILTAKTGSVRVRSVSEDWLSGIPGMDLFRRWRVNSKKKSTALLTFSDSSTLTMRENSLVIIYGPSTKSTTPNAPMVAQLETGALRTRLGKALGRGLVVQTPNSEASLKGGSSVIALDQETTVVSNHEGGGIVLKEIKDGKTTGSGVQVKAGMGSWAEKGKAPAKPKRLPPSPDWNDISGGALGLASTGVSLKASWKSVSDAEKYRVEVSLDPVARAVVAAAVVPSNITELEAHGFSAGDYYLSVSSIDKNGLESKPSKAERIRAAIVKVEGAAEQTPGEGEASPRNEEALPANVAFGSTLVAPDGMSCGFDANALQSKFKVLSSGQQGLICVDSDNAHYGLNLLVEGGRAYPDEATKNNSVLVGETIDIGFDVGELAQQDLVLRSCPEGEIKYINRHQTKLSARFRVLSQVSHCRVWLEIAGQELTEAEIQVMAPPSEPAVSPWDIRLELFTGFESHRFVPEMEDDAIGGFLGARVGWRPIHSHFRGEMEAAVLKGKDSFNQGQTAGFLAANLRVMTLGKTIRPFALLGVGANLIPEDSVKGQVHAGAGVYYYFSTTAVMVEIRTSLGEDRRHALDLLFGVSLPIH